MRYFSQCQGGRLTENCCKLCSESEPILFLILYPSYPPPTPPLKTLLQCELEVALWLCICEESQGWSWHAGSHTADKALSGCGADCRLSSYRKGRRNLAHEDEEGEEDVPDQPPNTGPTFLSLQPQHCTLSPVPSHTVPGIASSLPCFGRQKSDDQFRFHIMELQGPIPLENTIYLKDKMLTFFILHILTWGIISFFAFSQDYSDYFSILNPYFEI